MQWTLYILHTEDVAHPRTEQSLFKGYCNDDAEETRTRVFAISLIVLPLMIPQEGQRVSLKTYVVYRQEDSSIMWLLLFCVHLW